MVSQSIERHKGPHFQCADDEKSGLARQRLIAKGGTGTRAAMVQILVQLYRTTYIARDLSNEYKYDLSKSIDECHNENTGVAQTRRPSANADVVLVAVLKQVAALCEREISKNVKYNGEFEPSSLTPTHLYIRYGLH